MNKADWHKLIGDNEDRTITLSREQRNTLFAAANYIDRLEERNAALVGTHARMLQTIERAHAIATEKRGTAYSRMCRMDDVLRAALPVLETNSDARKETPREHGNALG